MSTVPIKATVPSTDDQAAVTAEIASLRKHLPFLITLAPAERKSTPRTGARIQGFIKQALDVAIQNPTVLPVAFDVNEMRGDMQLLAYLTSVQLALHQLLREVDDTVIQVGAQAYAAARTVYAAATSQFAGPPLEVAANQLGKHFGRKPKNAKPATGANASASTTAAASGTIPSKASVTPAPPPATTTPKV